MFGISENGALGFIKKCLEKNIIKKKKIDSYRFLNRQKSYREKDDQKRSYRGKLQKSHSESFKG
jgi:hypothetical protein